MTLAGAQFMPDSGWPCAAKCFSVAMTCCLVAESSVALETPHRGDAQARNQIRVFAVGLFDTAPARIARDIDHRRERLVRAPRRAPPAPSSRTATRPGPDRRLLPARSAAENSCRRSRRARAGTPRERSPGYPGGFLRGRTAGWRWSVRPSARASQAASPASLGRPTWPSP